MDIAAADVFGRRVIGDQDLGCDCVALSAPVPFLLQFVAPGTREYACLDVRRARRDSGSQDRCRPRQSPASRHATTESAREAMQSTCRQGRADHGES